jgi:hypothetical protein
MKRFVILFTAILGCNQAVKQHTTPALSTAPMPDWKFYEGDGFRFRYPARATVHAATSHPGNYPGFAIRGNIGEAHNPKERSSGELEFQLIVSVFPNPSGKTAEQWVDSVRQVWNHQLQSDSLEFLGPPDTVSINGLRGLRLRPFCGDCAPEEIYVTDASHTVVLSYVFDDVSNSADREKQRKLYQAILSTFVWRGNQRYLSPRPHTR